MAMPATALSDPALVALSERVKAAFAFRGLSLADPETAEIYGVALESVRPILDGALATGLLSAQQHTTLADLYDAAARAPEVV